jgi:hypothetical protein
MHTKDSANNTSGQQNRRGALAVGQAPVLGRKQDVANAASVSPGASTTGFGKSGYRLFALALDALDFTFQVLSLHYANSR